MNSALEVILQFPILSGIILLIVSPVIILLIRKAGHGCKLLGLYIRAPDRAAWMTGDLSPDEINSYFQLLASRHDACPRHGNRRIDRLHWQIYMGFVHLRGRLSHTPAGIIGMVPAARWYFDNYNFFYKALMAIQANGNLIKFHSMPALTDAAENRYPRVYSLARSIVSSSKFHLNIEHVFTIIENYLQGRQLLARELWTLPDMLTLCLLEKAAEQSRAVLRIINVKQEADRVVNHLSARLGHDEAGIPHLLRKMCKPGLLIDSAFVSHFYFRLKSMFIADKDIESWLIEAIGNPANQNGVWLQEVLDTEAENETSCSASYHR
ncbi:MAG TPA: hypothetical protein DCM45_05625 [Clostridiales bacterium]|nr:hypothetical protein [Clostridiales bacterium]